MNLTHEMQQATRTTVERTPQPIGPWSALKSRIDNQEKDFDSLSAKNYAIAIPSMVRFPHSESCPVLPACKR